MCRRQVERRTSLTRHKPLVAEQTPTPDATEKIDRFLAAERPDPPCLVVDLDVVRTKYAALRALFPDATLYYAVNANPAAGALPLWICSAPNPTSPAKAINRCLVFGIGAERFSFENTIKRNSEIARAYRSGVDRFAVDASYEFAESGEPSLNAIIDAFVDDKMKPLEAPGVPQQD